MSAQFEKRRRDYVVPPPRCADPTRERCDAGIIKRVDNWRLEWQTAYQVLESCLECREA